MMCAVTIQMKPLIHRLRFYRKKFIIFCEFVLSVLGVGPCHKNFAL